MLVVHVMKNILIPIVTVIGLELAPVAAEMAGLTGKGAALPGNGATVAISMPSSPDKGRRGTRDRDGLTIAIGTAMK